MQSRLLAWILSSMMVLLANAGGSGPSHHYVSFLKRMDPTTNFYDQQRRLPEFPFHHRLSGAVNLTATPELLEKSGDYVTVTWSGISNAASNDWIGIYMSDEAADTDYLDYEYVNVAENWQSGEGLIQFRIINMRTVYQFRYFQYQGSNAYNLIALSNTFTFQNMNEPTQGHIAFGDDPSEITVMFTSASWSLPTVQYGLASGNLTMSVQGTSWTYQAQNMCSAPATIEGPGNFIDPGVLHDVLLRDLLPDTRYYYRFGQDGVFGAEFSFRTAPLPMARDHTKFIVYGDMGSTLPGTGGVIDLLLKDIQTNEYDYVLHFGDVSYAMGTGFVWEDFMNLVEPIAATLPYMVSIGNHEYCYLTGGENDPSGAPGNGYHPEWGNYGSDSLGECGVPMFYRYRMPNNGNSLFWYSFQYGPVHVIQISSEHDFEPGSDQYVWMEADLARVDREVTPWVILTSHRPMYNSERYPDDFQVGENMARLFEDLLLQYDVDLLLAGHYHSYERTCSVAEGKCVSEDEGIVHVTIGSAGAWVDFAPYYNVEWSVYAEQTYGYGRIEADRSSLTLEFVRSKDGQITDKVTLFK